MKHSIISHDKGSEEVVFVTIGHHGKIVGKYGQISEYFGDLVRVFEGIY